jgi:hypothetical protein
VSGVPRLPDLTTLSGEQKDQLIIDLWQTVLTLDGAVLMPAFERTTERRNRLDLQARISGIPASRRAWTPRKPSGTQLSKSLLAVLLVIGVGFLADFAVTRYQQHSLETRNRATLELENAAFNGLNVELVRVFQEPDGASYRALMAMHNTYAASLYIMLNPVRVFVQVGRNWQEQRARAAGAAGWGVVELRSDRDYQVVFSVEVKDWRELIPGYMHIRIDSDMLISRRSEPARDIVERNNRFYVYLKPQHADDAAIQRQSHFSGTPPVFIPMPPH